ncbi:MAG: hypothetical protein ABJB01_07695 [Rudaea sp.]
MSKASLILEKVARLTRVIRLKRHIGAIAQAVESMTPSDLLQLRAAFDNAALHFDASSLPKNEESDPRHFADRILDALNAMSIDRHLASDSAIVRVRYVAKWLAQAIRLTVGSADTDLQGLHRRAVAILRGVQGDPGANRQKSWFLGGDKKVS